MALLVPPCLGGCQAQKGEQTVEHAVIKGLDVQVMVSLVDDGWLGPDWDRKAHLHLDFSHERFSLSTFKPRDFQWARPEKKGGERPTGERYVRVDKLHSLNLDDNELTNAVFENSIICAKDPKDNSKDMTCFRSLRILRMRNNRLTDTPLIQLPRLKELYLSGNSIEGIPPLGLLPVLEVLDLSRNKIKTLSVDNLKAENILQHLQVFDLSSNQIGSDQAGPNFRPSEFLDVMECLGDKAKGLTSVQLQDNPFCLYFSEYQLVVERFVNKDLQRLDDLHFGRHPDLRETLRKQSESIFGDESEVKDRMRDMDESYELRKKLCEKSAPEQERRMCVASPKTPSGADGAKSPKPKSGGARAARAQDTKDVKLKYLIEQLDSVLEEPANASSSVREVLAGANAVAESGDTLSIFKGVVDRAERMEMVATFVQQIVTIAERHEDTRTLLIRTLARFCCVPDYHMSDLCLAALGSMAKNEDTMNDVLEVVEEVILPPLSDMQLEDKRCGNIIIGLSNFNCDMLAGKLKNVLPQLCEFTVANRTHLERNGGGPDVLMLQIALSKLMLTLVQDPTNANMLLNDHKDIISAMTKDVMSKDHFLSTDHFTNYVTWTKTLQMLVKNVTESAKKDCLKLWVKNKLHTELALRISDVIGSGKKETEDLGFVVCKKVAAALDIIFVMMERDEVLESLLRPEATLVPNMLRMAAEEVCDPVVLGACLRGLNIVLHSSKGEMFLKDIVAKLKLKESNCILPYIDRKKFKDLYTLSEKHYAYSDTEQENRTGGFPSVPDLNGATNPIAHDTMAAIVEFLHTFSELKDKSTLCEEVAPLCKEVAEKLDKEGRDTKLFKLLEVPSDQVSKAVLTCLGKMDATELDDEDIRILLSLLKPESVARAEKLLSEAIQKLQKIVLGCDSLRSRFAPLVLKKVFEILTNNAKRKTYGNKEQEESKRALSDKAVTFLSVAGSAEYAILRKYLRNKEYVGTFNEVLYYEQNENSYDTGDVCVELTWTGRHIPYLFLCMSSDLALNAYRKQAFRVFARVADVVAGVPLELSGYRSFMAHDRAKTEAGFWSDGMMLSRLGKLDEDCMQDRLEQQQHFSLFSGIEHMVRFLESANAKLAKDIAEFGAEDREIAGQVAKSQEECMQRLRHWLDEEPHSDDEIAPSDHGDTKLTDAFMQECWRPPPQKIPAKIFATPQVPKMLQGNHAFYIEGTGGNVYPVYTLAALMRAIYAMLLVPASEVYRESVLVQLSELGLQARLIGLVECSGSYVHCNIAAKLMRVMSLVIGLQPGQHKVTGRTRLTSALTFAEFACKCLRMMAPLLASLGASMQITAEQHCLCEEAVRLLARISVVISKMSSPKLEDERKRKEVIDSVFKYILKPEALRSILMCALYDMTADLGSLHGTFITDDFTRSAMGRRDMFGLVSDLLSVVCHWSPELKTHVLYLFAEYKWIGKHRISSSFITDIIHRTEMQLFTELLQERLQASTGDRNEYVLACAYCEMPALGHKWTLSLRKPGTGPRMLVVTNKRMLFMARMRHRMQDRPCGACPPESLCPIAPEIERQEHIENITRIMPGPEAQVLILGWMQKGAKTEKLDFIVLHRSDIRSTLIPLLQALSGPTMETSVSPIRENFLKSCIENRNPSTILCMSFAVRENCIPGVAPGTVGSERLSLFVLTETEFCEFQVDFNAWLDTGMDKDVPHFDMEQTPHPSKLSPDDDPLEMAAGNNDRQAHREWKKLYEYNQKLHKVAQDAMAFLLSTDAQPSSSGASRSQQAVVAERQADRFVWASSCSEPENLPSKRLAARDATINSMLGSSSSAAPVSAAPCLGLANRKQNNNSSDENRAMVYAEMRRKILTHQERHREQMHSMKLIEFGGGNVSRVRIGFLKAKDDSDLCYYDLRFLDDHARELWRRTLALALIRSAADGAWQRQWNEDSPTAVDTATK